MIELIKDGTGYWIIVTDETTQIEQRLAVTAKEIVDLVKVISKEYSHILSTVAEDEQLSKLLDL